MKTGRSVSLVAALAFASACGRGVTALQEPEMSGSPSAVSASPIPSPRASPMPPIPSTWPMLRSEEAGIAFRFPPLDGEVKYRFDRYARADGPCVSDPSGLFYRWLLVREDGYRYHFAGGLSRDAAEGRDGWPTDIYRWTRRGSAAAYDFCGRLRDVEPLRVVTRPDGTEALIFAPRSDFRLEEVPSNEDRGDRVAVLEFPPGYHDDFASVVFYFLDPTPLDDIEAVVRSVEFTR